MCGSVHLDSSIIVLILSIVKHLLNGDHTLFNSDHTFELREMFVEILMETSCQPRPPIVPCYGLLKLSAIFLFPPPSPTWALTKS